MPSMRAPMRAREVREVLDVRLAGGVAQDRRALGRDRGHERVLGAGDARLVEEDVGAAQAAARGTRYASSSSNVGAELLEREEVRVDAAPADDVAARRRQRRPVRSARAAARRAGSTRGSCAQSAGSSSPARTVFAWISSVLFAVQSRRWHRPNARARRASRCPGCAGRSRA